MTLLLKKPLESEDFLPRKRARHTGEFQDCAQEAQQDTRVLRRRKLDEIYEQNRSEMESDIERNIDSELQSCKRRKKVLFGKTYDEETVRSMISVALDTQKEKLFETFIEQTLEDLAHYEQIIHFMFDTHSVQNASLTTTYIS